MTNKDFQKYKVGYGCPPKEYQFKPGQSGNPKGRPKKNNSFAEDILEEMSEMITIQVNGKLKKITKKRALAKRLIADSLSGKVSAIKILTPILAGETNIKNDVEEELTPLDAQILEDYIQRRLSNER